MAPRIDLNALVLFHDVVNARSINKAAQALNLPKSTISRRLRLLEEQLGTTLLKRGARALGLTESGRALYQRCEHIVAELEEASMQASEVQGEMRGVLRVSMPVFFIGWVSEAIADFAKRNPELRLEIEAHNRQIDVAEEPFDVAIHFGNPPETFHPSRKLAELPRSFYAAPAYLAERGMPKAYRELSGHDLVQHQYQIRDKVFPWLEQQNGQAAPPSARAVVNHAVLVRELVLGGVGIGLMPDIMCRQDLADGALVRIPLEWQSPPLAASATYLTRRYAPAKMRRFLDAISTYLQSHA